MLEQLFGSRTRTKLLKLFLTNPDQAFFIRELTRKIDTQINSVRRELKNLLDTGVLAELGQEEVDRALEAQRRNGVHAAMANTQEDEEDEEEGLSASDRQVKKYFKVDLDFPLYHELRALFIKSPQLFQKRLGSELEAMGGVHYASMMGFFVSDAAAQVDVLVIGEVDKARFNKVIGELEEELERELNFTIMDMGEYRYRKSVTDKFLFNLLESKKIVLVNKLAEQG